VEGATKSHYKKLKRYIKANREMVKCCKCHKGIQLKAGYIGSQCKIVGCKHYYCKSCAVYKIVEKWGNRTKKIGDKYVKGWHECKACDQAGRFINAMTYQYLTKYDESA
jgi:hypothetical protein